MANILFMNKQIVHMLASDADTSKQVEARLAMQDFISTSNGSDGVCSVFAGNAHTRNPEPIWREDVASSS